MSIIKNYFTLNECVNKRLTSLTSQHLRSYIANLTKDDNNKYIRNSVVDGKRVIEIHRSLLLKFSEGKLKEQEEDYYCRTEFNIDFDLSYSSESLKLFIKNYPSCFNFEYCVYEADDKLILFVLTYDTVKYTKFALRSFLNKIGISLSEVDVIIRATNSTDVLIELASKGYDIKVTKNIKPDHTGLKFGKRNYKKIVSLLGENSLKKVGS